MEARLVTSADELRRYDAWVKAHPHGTLWQSLEWKTFQEALGREVRIYAIMEGPDIAAAALVVIDRTTFGLSTWELPRGPLLSGKWKVESGKFMEKILGDAKTDRAFTLFLSPSDPLTTYHLPLTTSCRFVMPEATRALDLTLTDEELLAQMKPKGRYNIRLAQKHGVTVEKSTDAVAFGALADQTARRDGFTAHSPAFYRTFLEQLPGSFLLMAHAPGTQKTPLEGHGHRERSNGLQKPIVGLLGVIWGPTGLPAGARSAKVGLYYYGASSDSHRELMAPYVLQWEAMRHCRRHGCTTYDLFGIAPPDQPQHPWAGVSDFKAKFGGDVVMYPPEQEIVLRPWVKRILEWKRKVI